MRADTVVNRGGILGSVTDSDPIKTRIKQALALRENAITTRMCGR